MPHLSDEQMKAISLAKKLATEYQAVLKQQITALMPSVYVAKSALASASKALTDPALQSLNLSSLAPNLDYFSKLDLTSNIMPIIQEARKFTAPGTFVGDMLLVLDEPDNPDAYKPARRLVTHYLEWRPDIHTVGGFAAQAVLKAKAGAEKKTVKQMKIDLLTVAFLDATRERIQEPYRQSGVDELFNEISQRAVTIVEQKLLQTEVTASGLFLLQSGSIYVPTRGRPKGSGVMPKDKFMLELEKALTSLRQGRSRATQSAVARQIGMSERILITYFERYNLNWNELKWN